jgi:phosphoribosylformylglycinamidine (FGAM) synthase-like amidotransferase family enzyme
MSDYVVIKKGGMELIKTDRSNLITAEPSPDGVVFTFKNGFQVMYSDSYMPIHTKDMARNASNSFPTANLIFDMANYAHPVLVEPTKK